MNIMNEGLDKNQRRAGQLGLTEKVGKNGARGKLVGANESMDGNSQSTKMFLEVDDDQELIDEADLIISPALFGKGDRSFKPKHADHEVSMARNDCFQSAVNAAKVFKMLRNVSEMQGIDGWVASKITLAADYLNTVREYLEGQQLERNSMRGMTETQHHNDQSEDFLDPEDEDYDDNIVPDEEELVDISGPLADLTSEFEKYSGILDTQKKPQYEMMLPNGQARKFRANDDEDARHIAKSLGATSLIKVRNNSSDINEAQLDELKCWPGYTRVRGVPAGAPGSCKKKSKTKESVVEGSEEKDPIWNKGTPMPKDYTCSCGIHVHPSVKKPGAIHAKDCPYAEKQGVAEGTNKRIKGGDPCRDKYKMVGMKQKGGRPVPNCVLSNPPKKKKK